MNAVILEACQCDYVLSYQEAIKSHIIKDMLDDAGTEHMHRIPLPKNIQPCIMNPIVEFLKFHVDNPILFFNPPLLTAVLSDYLTPWDQAWTAKLATGGFLVDVMNAADYLFIPDMLKVCMCYLAMECKNNAQSF
jgi:hypothetical protein